MSKLLMLISVFFMPYFAKGQTKLPIIKATSKNVTIKDDGFLDLNAWTLSPKIKPDIYKADRSRKTKWVVFYTDIDSIKVKVKVGTTFNFIVLLNGKDTCYTQIASAIPLENTINVAKNTPDTIPFTLTKFNAIHVKAVVNELDTLNLHFDIGSFDFRFTQEAILKKTHLLSRQPDALSGKTKPNFNNLDKVFKIQMGQLTWQNPEIVTTLLTAHDMDGRFGWNIFEGKTVEIDYDKSLIIVHPKMPKHIKGYSKSKLTFLRSFPCIKGELGIKDKKYTGLFILDTGSDKAMILDSTWRVKQQLPTDLKLIKVATFKNPRGVKFETKTVNCPSLTLNNYPLTNIPTTLLGSQSPLNFEVNLLGNDVLKRFNTILDLKNDCIYLKPNTLIGLPFKEAS